jgi:hypothetical protein
MVVEAARGLCCQAYRTSSSDGAAFLRWRGENGA